MTTDTVLRPPCSPAPDTVPSPAWLEDLFDHLPAGCFPGTHDDLVAALVRQHAPSHLLWHLSVLPRTRRFESTDELLAHLGQPPASVATVSVPT